MKKLIKEDYLEVQWLRLLAVLLLVTWHCFFCVIFIWGVVEPNPKILFLRYLSRFMMPDAVMPLFTFVSGYLFYALYFDREKYRVFKNFIKSKIKRLLIPFAIFSVLIVLSTPNLHFEPIIWGHGTHMWYCAMLFWCFIIAWLLLKVNSRFLISFVIALSTILVFAYPNFFYMPIDLPIGIDNGFYYFSYFALGGAIFNYKQKIFQWLQSKVLIVAGVYTGLWLLNISGIHIISRIAFSFQCYLFVIFLWIIVMKLINLSYLKQSKRLTQLCDCSFGIYVFHHWIAWNIVWYPPVSLFLRRDYNYVWLPLIMTPLIFGISYFVTKLLLKTRIGNFLLA